LSVHRDIFINSVKLLELNGQRSIPTAIKYVGNKRQIGFEVFENESSSASIFNNFKIGLGTTDQSKFRIAGNTQTPFRSLQGIASDYFFEVLNDAEKSLKGHGKSLPEKVLIAEPLSLSGTDTKQEEWLSNYRKSVKKSVGSRFKEVDFLPEPFAVFQFYRYGLRNPLIAQEKKHVALVIDFGGGTFDVSVIETTAEGNISKGGRNSKPLGASSTAVGGFLINKCIAEYILFSRLENKELKTKVRKAITQFDDWHLNPEKELSDFSEPIQRFFEFYSGFLLTIENVKLFISTSINDWSLTTENPSEAGVPISIPRDPFDPLKPSDQMRFTAAMFREVFCEEIWKKRLTNAVDKAIRRAAEELNGKPISIALLSGGSSSIGWLKQLLIRDFNNIFGEIDVLEFKEESQEIVAKGLAIECARRFHTAGEGDFRATTYNRLCLVLSSNDGAKEIKNFQPIGGFVNSSGEPGVILPTSTNLRHLIDQPLRWRIKLSKPPTQHLDYYFLRSTLDPEDIESMQNIMETRIFTPKGTRMGSDIEIELKVREDGTAIPKIIYNKSDENSFKEGLPFYLDMTFAAEETTGSNYLGFDFGSSTTAISFVDKNDIQEFERRATNQSWLEVSELISSMPYPIASPLSYFVAETSQTGLNERGRAVIESMLTIAAYTIYAEYCANIGKSGTRLFKNFTQRSAGPLWHFIKQTMPLLNNNSHYSKMLIELFCSSFSLELDKAVQAISDLKHEKEAHLNYQAILGPLGNCLAKTFGNFPVGFFEESRPKPYEDGIFVGSFRSLVGQHPPFFNMLKYEGPHVFDNKSIFIIDPKRGSAIRLSPLITIGLSKIAGNTHDEIHVFDKKTRDDYLFKAVQLAAALSLNSNEITLGLKKHLEKMDEQDLKIEERNGLTFYA